ncbi:hypothetical protein CONCODRAFT_20063 [Conidiobolus coronatus NRRL 28638]|uniref:Uncharacterized protein n=1 Tax=Conidiobolus coronatus (strain ATCC 28846 / CBS 209.66 / NRRL 28638) TaxID=796925 RepID=A0A137NVQ5_CONC2|nr:hypothetical protein CONCODRAFT_20063 [Conidiobolus coronatus NRRL 28638]|eukprot:KXN66758.1 hypothetical protein CONCODRAFT_20063 [Conidiobolus coronatus NRRL 28638]
MDNALEEELLIIISGKYEALLVSNEDKQLIIIEDHYSNGSGFRLEKIDNLNYLKYEESFLRCNNGIMKVCSSFDDIDALLVSEPIDDIFFTLKCTKEGYFDEYLEICEAEEAIRLQWTSGDQYLGEELNSFLKEYISSDLKSSYISADGIDLVKSSKLFNMMLEGDIYCNLLQSPEFIFQDDLFYTGIAMRFVEINNMTCLKSENDKYLGLYRSYCGDLIPMLIDEVPELPIGLIRTDNVGVYLLGRDNQYVKVIPVNSFSISEITDNLEDASKFQFIFYNDTFVYEESEPDSG